MDKDKDNNNNTRSWTMWRRKSSDNKTPETGSSASISSPFSDDQGSILFCTRLPISALKSVNHSYVNYTSVKHRCLSLALSFLKSSKVSIRLYVNAMFSVYILSQEQPFAMSKKTTSANFDNNQSFHRVNESFTNHSIRAYHGLKEIVCRDLSKPLKAFTTHSSQSLEAISKALHTDEEINDESVKTLAEKLSTALLDIRAKEDLVKQHAKVAEEAVSGWEKAGKEASALKQQLDTAVQKKLVLEDRTGHLDAALKQCVRQLRQAREEQEQKIQEAVINKTSEWETVKSKLESQLTELRAQLQTAKTHSVPLDSDLSSRLEKENSALKLELLSQAEDLELRIIERDLSNQAAETASKQRLESIKKIAKLEAEIRKLKALVQKASLTNNDQKSFTDSQSGTGERLLAVDADTRKISGLDINECEPRHLDINFMDDFLETERFAALPATENASNREESPLKAELSAMISRTADLEERLEKIEAENMELKISLTESEQQLEKSKRLLRESEVKLEELLTQLSMENKSKQAIEEELKAANMQREEAELRHGLAKVENKTLLSKVASLGEEIEQERAVLSEHVVTRQKLENELSEKKHEAELQREAELHRLANTKVDFKVMQETELALAATKFAECQKTIASLGEQIKSLATLEDFLLDSENPADIHAEELPRNGQASSLQLGDSYKKSHSFKILSERLKLSKSGIERLSSSPTNPVIASERNRKARGGKVHPRRKNDNQ
ncbi:hypothetical protein ACFE04_018854 [Oxalis oulophora]